MTKDQIINQRIDRLLQREQWQKARQLLESEHAKSPRSHWVLTQLAVTYYEEQQHLEALNLLLQSLAIKDDCPLTLWNLAGTLDALGRSRDAQELFKWIYKSNKSSSDDPCWEGPEWTAALKADSVFRLGDTAMHLGDAQLAERYYRDYIDLWLAGVKGSYPIEEVAQDIQKSRGSDTHSAAKKESLRISTSGKIPRSALKPSAAMYSPVKEISALLRGKQIAWRQIASQSQQDGLNSVRAKSHWKTKKAAGKAS